MRIGPFLLLIAALGMWYGWRAWEEQRILDRFRQVAELAERTNSAHGLEVFPELQEVLWKDRGETVSFSRPGESWRVATQKVELRVSKAAWSERGNLGLQALAGLWLVGLVMAGRIPKPVVLPQPAKLPPPLPSSGDLVLELDADGLIAAVRAGDCRSVTGWSAEDLIGRKSAELADESGLIRRKDGVCVQVQLSWGKLDDGRRLLMIKNAETRSEFFQRRILDVEQQFRDLCDSASDLVVVILPDGQPLYANRAFLEHSGYTAEELHSKTFADLVEDGGPIVLRALAGDRLEASELQLICKDGRRLPIEGSLFMTRANGSTLMAIFRDLSERRRTEETLRQAQKMEAVGRLAGGVAHDFNNLLTVMRSVTGLLREELEAQERSELMTDLESAIERATELTSQLLLFCRKTTVQLKPVQLGEVVKNILKLAARMLGEDVQLNSSLQSRSTVLADRAELEQVLMNLLVNSRDAMPDGGTIEVSTKDVELAKPLQVLGDHLSAGRYCRLQVKDSGHGIPADVLPSIFEPYFTTKSVGKGTGLGLSTVYAVVNRMCGGLEVQTGKGQGTTFSIYFPAEPADVPCEKIVPSSQTEETGQGTILLVEDEDAVRHVISRLLRLRGYRVVETGNPMEALALFSQRKEIDMLITDLVMPGLRGCDLASELRRQRPELPILFISGYPGEQVLENLGPREAFLSKPFSMDELANLARRLISA